MCIRDSNYTSIKLLPIKKKVGKALNPRKHCYTLGTGVGAGQDRKDKDGSPETVDQWLSNVAAQRTYVGSFYLNQLY